MKNRIPTELAANGALRYGVYDKDGNLLRYEYLKLEDNPTDPGTALSKETLLKDATAALFGLDDNAVPDDALAFLGKYNHHWWSKREYTPPTLTLGEEDDFGLSFAGVSVKYSSEVTVNQSGAVELSGTIKTKTLSSGSAAKTFFNSIKGQYFIFPDDGDGVVYYKTTTSATSSGDYTCYVYCKEVSGVPGSLGNVIGYETANDAGAFPENGAVDSVWYTYLGIPFDNAVTAAKIERGSYIGTGGYGKANATSLTFSFIPKTILLYEGLYQGGPVNKGEGSRPMNGVALINAERLTSEYSQIYLFNQISDSYATTVKLDDTTFSFYASALAYAFNASGVEYFYIALS